MIDSLVSVELFGLVVKPVLSLSLSKLLEFFFDGNMTNYIHEIGDSLKALGMRGP